MTPENGKHAKMIIKSVNPKHQKSVNRFLTWDQKYDQAVNENQQADRDDSPAQSRAYNRAADLWSALPKREQQNIVKHKPALKGCY
ncbi:hypothetical protein PG288_6 [Vibrio phage PG288]|nr:hypothetical protein PG288_6 [Vibrio phage PG288]